MKDDDLIELSESRELAQRKTSAIESLSAMADEIADSDESSSHTANRRGLVLGGDDPRDAALEEHPVAENTMYQGLIFNVSRLDVQLSDGQMAARDVVRHPGAVAIVALSDDGRICLVRQYRASLGRVTVEIPAGKLDPGEDPLDCARRELEEETGFSSEKIAFLTSFITSVGFSDEVIYLYMATGIKQGEAHPDEDEFINVDLVDLDEVINAVLDGRIEDVKTIVGALACDAISRRLSP
ncbi:MAG: NUDIX hydrolase [Atopobiaceae bacterium]|nr:NUDIX hydrolase [Atopobiaceae bacterium]